MFWKKISLLGKKGKRFLIKLMPAKKEASGEIKTKGISDVSMDFLRQNRNIPDLSEIKKIRGQRKSKISVDLKIQEFSNNQRFPVSPENKKDFHEISEHSQKSEIFDVGKREFIKKGAIGVGAGVGAALLSKIPFADARLFTDGVSATNKTAAITIDGSGNVELANPLAVAEGGTGSATAGGARTNLGISAMSNFGSSGIFLDGNMIVERYSAESGEFGLVDVGNSTSLYDSTNDTYEQGIVQTNILYNSTTEITSLLVEEVTTTKATTQGTVDVSFDAGSSWSTGKTIGTSITSFTGTAADGSDYKLMLKFNLGSSYGGGVWATTGALNVGRNGSIGCGTTADSLVTGGGDPTELNSTEKWNGSSWTTTGVINQARVYLAGCGTTGDALCFGGSTGSLANVDSSEKWSGSSWATTGALTETKRNVVGCGITAAALCFGGNSGGEITTSEKWTGSWATTTAITETRRSHAGCGTTAAALLFGGFQGASNSKDTEKWNGSSWATTTSLISGGGEAPAGCGTTGDALCFGGNAGTAITEKWNGSSWSTTTSLTTSKYWAAGCGTTAAALSISNENSSTTTEKWSYPVANHLGFAAKIN